MPPWLDQAIDVGGGRVLPTHALSPVSQPYDLYKTIRGEADAQTIADMTNPAIQAAWQVASQRNQYGEHVGRLQALEEAGAGLEPPLSKLVRGEIHPEPSNYYSEDASRLGRLARASRVAPIRVDPSGSSADTYHLVHESRDAGLGDPPAQVLQELRFESELNHEVHKKEKDWGHLAGLVAGMYDALHPGSSIVRDAHNLPDEAAAERFYHAVRRGLFSELHDWRRHIDYVQEQRLATAG